MVKNKTTRSAILKVIGKIVQREVAAICSDKHHSVLRLNTKDSVTNFEYVISNLMGEMSHRAPVLLSILQSCLKTKTPRRNTDVLVTMITSILCKNRRPSACLFQRIVSLLLYSGHASKKVSSIKKASCIHHHCTKLHILNSYTTRPRELPSVETPKAQGCGDLSAAKVLLGA